MSNRLVGKLLQRLSYVLRLGGITPQPTEPVKACNISIFLIEKNYAFAQEDQGRAIIVYMDENFVHQLHSSAYSYFQRDKEVVAHYGFGRTSGKKQRVIMVHAITKYRSLVTCDMDGFPVLEGPFKPKANDRGLESPESRCGGAPTAEFL